MEIRDLYELIQVIAAREMGRGGGGAREVADAPASPSAAGAPPRASGAQAVSSADPGELIAWISAPLRADPEGAGEGGTGAQAVSRSAALERTSAPYTPLVRSLVSGFGLVSAIGRLLGGNTRSEESEVLPRFSLPERIHEEVAYDAATRQFSPLDRWQSGAARVEGVPAPTQVTVNVQAMDSKSFLDHSDDIARAVKQAILSSHSLNDVLSEI